MMCCVSSFILFVQRRGDGQHVEWQTPYMQTDEDFRLSVHNLREHAAGY